MKPVMQTITTVPGGNYFAACIASILELPIEDVPNFVNEYGDTYFIETTKWLNRRGHAILSIKYSANFCIENSPYYIFSGDSPRGTCAHAVVGKFEDYAVRLVHDPHPHGTFIAGSPTWVWFIMPLGEHSSETLQLSSV